LKSSFLIEATVSIQIGEVAFGGRHDKEGKEKKTFDDHTQQSTRKGSNNNSGGERVYSSGRERAISKFKKVIR
jgi:hypothetical protein